MKIMKTQVCSINYFFQSKVVMNACRIMLDKMIWTVPYSRRSPAASLAQRLRTCSCWLANMAVDCCARAIRATSTAAGTVRPAAGDGAASQFHSITHTPAIGPFCGEKSNFLSQSVWSSAKPLWSIERQMSAPDGRVVIPGAAQGLPGPQNGNEQGQRLCSPRWETMWHTQLGLLATDYLFLPQTHTSFNERIL